MLKNEEYKRTFLIPAQPPTLPDNSRLRGRCCRVSAIIFFLKNSLRKNYRQSDDREVYFIDRRSEDHISLFFTKVTYDPTIKFRFCIKKLQTTRQSHYDHISVFFPKVTDDPTIKIRFFCKKVREKHSIGIFFYQY